MGVGVSEEVVLQHIRDRWPGLGERMAGYVLWNHTCFPLCDPNALEVTDEGNLAHWMKQVEDYVKESVIHWQRLYG